MLEPLCTPDGQLLEYARDLSRVYRRSRADLEEAYLDTVHRLAVAAEYRDDDTGEHIERIGLMSAALARLLGLPERFVRDIRYAATMHDVGKIGIPDSILLKPGRLSEEEFARMQEHTVIGARILDGSSASLLTMSRWIALTHHEANDGSGYPRGLAGSDIPLEGRIVGVVDTFDALRSKRPYKDPYPLPVCLRILAEGRGSRFDPQVLDAFLNNLEKIMVGVQRIEDAGHKSYRPSERDVVAGIVSRAEGDRS